MLPAQIIAGGTRVHEPEQWRQQLAHAANSMLLHRQTHQQPYAGTILLFHGRFPSRFLIVLRHRVGAGQASRAAAAAAALAVSSRAFVRCCLLQARST